MVLKENGLDLAFNESEVQISGKWSSGNLSRITDLSARHISFLTISEVELIYNELAANTDILDFFNFKLPTIKELNVKLMENSFLSSQGIKERVSFDSRMKIKTEPTKKELLKALIKKIFS